jgi:hypothetical protein
VSRIVIAIESAFLAMAPHYESTAGRLLDRYTMRSVNHPKSGGKCEKSPLSAALISCFRIMGHDA